MNTLTLGVKVSGAMFTSELSNTGTYQNSYDMIQKKCRNFYLINCPVASLAQLHVRVKVSCSSTKLAICKNCRLHIKFLKLCTFQAQKI